MLNKEFSNKVFFSLQITTHFFTGIVKKKVNDHEGNICAPEHYSSQIGKSIHNTLYFLKICIAVRLTYHEILQYTHKVHSITLLYHISFGTLRSLGNYTAYICKRYTRVSTLNTDLVMFEIIHGSFLRGCCQNQITNLYAEVAVLHASDFEGFQKATIRRNVMLQVNAVLLPRTWLVVKRVAVVRTSV